MSTLTAPQPSVLTSPAASNVAGRVRQLGQYTACNQLQRRVIVRLSRPDGGALVIDRRAEDHADARVVAEIAPDEPAENARLACRLYLADECRGRCRKLIQQDLDGPASPSGPDCVSDETTPGEIVGDDAGYLYGVREIETGGPLRELRWTRFADQGREGPFAPVGLREVVASLQYYEPAQRITAAALIAYEGRAGVSVYRLACELERLACSPILLNRRLRETVQGKVARGELTLSEIAVRCGRLKRDRRGNTSGETSWLARRIGQQPEGGEQQPTPWIRSDVLALIARDGLGVSPREVEL
jgi:hypothetical protein